MHLFLSPHLDDAVLSCGGLIYQLAQAGEAVTVFSVMAGPLPDGLKPTPFITEHLQRWGLGDDPVPGRRAEDTQAVEALGGTVRFGSFPDLLYRTDSEGHAIYADLEAMFGPIDPRDPVLAQLDEITAPLAEAATVYVPLGAGNHVDHQLVRNAVLAWLPRAPRLAVFFYEEYPYSADGADVVERALAAMQRPLETHLTLLSADALEAKIQAIACYTSQISTFWEDKAAMAAAVRRDIVQVGSGQPAERLWQFETT